MKVDGSCHCGYVTYKAEIDPEKVGVCHCTDCQTLSGTAFRTIALVREQDFELLTGKPKDYVKTAESGAKRIQAFCPQCGSPLYATSAGDAPRIFNIRLGTVRQRNDLPPKIQYWFRSAQSWLFNLDKVNKIEHQKN